MDAARNGMPETISRALAALREGRLDEAERLSRALLAALPNEPAPHQLAAAVALQGGRYAEAEASARACLALRPDHPPALAIAAHAARARGDRQGAKAWLRRASEVAPDEPQALLPYALAQIESADPATGETLATLARRFPGQADGWRDIGMALMRVNQLEGAEAAFVRAADAADDPAHAINLGRVRLARGRAAEAIAPLRRAVSRAPERLEACLPLAQALRQVGLPLEALEHLQRLAAAQPGNALAFYTLGLVCGDLRDWQGAIKAYGRSIDLKPDMPEAHVNLGLALQQIGEWERAKACYRRAIQLRPDTFGRIAQALPSTQRGELWLDTRKLRRSLGG
jgi:tetratricopeptide (TPR) repeat protein